MKVALLYRCRPCGQGHGVHALVDEVGGVPVVKPSRDGLLLVRCCRKGFSVAELVAVEPVIEVVDVLAGPPG